MSKQELRMGFAFCGSYCTWEKAMKALERAAQTYTEVIPIVSEKSAGTDTRFGEAADFLNRMEALTGHTPLTSIRETEPFGPKGLLDILAVVPCTGNTLAKLAGGITDSSVTMAVKAHLRNLRPVVLAPSTNDGLSISLCSIGALLCRKNYYFVPFGQDDPVKKPNSLVADFDRLEETIRWALQGKQLQPVLLGGTA
ncbi:MAG: dipicolinate synthase subunit B [Oscillospiraceae bacterium]|nr:dipicolinate synthase subunit B [Oscillospiraceae bacterium]